MKITVLVGVIGSGKTTKAREMSRREPWPVHISFDHVWHSLGQQLHAQDDPSWAVNSLAAAIQLLTQDVVIDGWWTWTRNWHRNREDNTLIMLAELVAPRRVEVQHLRIPDDDAVAWYMDPRRGEGLHLVKPEAYRATLAARNAYFERRIREWERSDAYCSARS